jgi:hypothetical protein
MAACSFEARARARGLILPDTDKEVVPRRKVVWDGKAMHLVEGDGSLERSRFTYNTGENMVGYVEQPCTESTKLLAGAYRFINAPNINKEGQDWKPGNRYTTAV